MRYTKTENGLTNAQDIPKIKNYACAEDVCDAVDNNELKVGEVFSIPVVNGIFDDLSGDIATIKSYIPNTTSIDNQLTNVSQVQDMIESGGASFDACWTRLCNVETCADTNHSNIVQIGAVIPSDATSANQLVTNTTLTTCLSCKVDCSDYSTAISNLGSCPGLNCTGTLVASDLTSINNSISALESCPGLSCTGTLVPSDLNTINTCITCLNACSGLNCTGTLVPSDLDTINTCISCLNACPGLNCTGTLVASDIANKATCSDLNSVSNRVTNLENCAGLSCTGTLTSANFTLSGATLTITI